MISPEEIAAAKQTLGGRLAALRQAEGHNQHVLARMLFTSRSSVANIERGRQVGTRDFWERCDSFLHANGALLRNYDALRELEARQRREAATAPAIMKFAREPSHAENIGGGVRGASSSLETVREGLRVALVTYRSARIKAGAPSVRDVWARTVSAHLAYQRADYDAAARMLPTLLDDAQSLALTTSGRQREQALRAVAASHLAASKLACKVGDGELGWLAADRANTAANLADARALSTVATYQVACALLLLPGRAAQAEALAIAAADDLGQPEGKPDADRLSARGALLLFAALNAGHRGDHADAQNYLEAASAAANQLGRDDNRMWTAFGPSNVAIHEMSIAVALGQPEQTVKIGERLDVSRLPAGLGGRRAQVHLELAAAHAHRPEGDPVAVLHLLEAERVAAQAVCVNIDARDLLTTLLSRERRSATPGLRPLAQRAGVAA